MGYNVTIPAGPPWTTINLTLMDEGGADPNFVLNALDVRPDNSGNSSVGQIQLQRGAEATAPLKQRPLPARAPTPAFPTTLDANGLTQDVYTGINAPPNSLITVTTSLDTPTQSYVLGDGAVNTPPQDASACSSARR